MNPMMKRTAGEAIFNVFNYIFLAAIALATAYPLLYVLFASFSDAGLLFTHSGLLWKPLGFSLQGYELVFKNPNILVGYRNTLFVVVVGVTMNMFMTILFAYVISRQKVYWNGLLTFVATFTMFFNGGIIPLFLVVRNLGLFGSLFSLIFPGLISTWNLIIMRTSFREIPGELLESAHMDGANHLVILFRIVVPLSKAVIAVVTLFYAANYWNAWVYASFFITDKAKFTLQLVLRELLIIQDQLSLMGAFTPEDFALGKVVKYSAIIIATVPILCLYPYVQKYFTTGIMVGAVKG